MELLKRVKEHGLNRGDCMAYHDGQTGISYKELNAYSDRIASFLLETLPGDHSPIPVYGHKHPLMIAAFLGCVKAGHAYCPIDICMPMDRVKEIIGSLNTPLVFAIVEEEKTAAESLKGEADPEGRSSSVRVVTLSELLSIATGDPKEYPAPGEEAGLGLSDTFYMIFTSGSTGKPKGVQIPYECLNHFLDWSETLVDLPAGTEPIRFLNQAPFSFDLSVMDLYTYLAMGGTLQALDKETQNNYRLLFDRIRGADPEVWVSTPSFAELCLADPSFDGKLAPHLSRFLFCGERLANATALKLLQRFPGARVLNTYGPTESTVAVTAVEVTSEMCNEKEAIPVGRVKPGSFLRIARPDGQEAAEGEKGEILILGDTVSTGYYGQEELTRKAFFEETSGSAAVRGYRTGDEGYLKDGMLFYSGRLDLQVKLHGYRIELGDIESNLLKIPNVRQACVVPSYREGKVTSLTAFIVPTELSREGKKDERKSAALIKEQLRAYLPDYMIPKKFQFLETLPMTVNGKADRKKLMETQR